MISLSPIAIVKNTRQFLANDDWGNLVSVIELLDPLNEEALAHIEDFSHGEVNFFLDRVDKRKIDTGALHPRNNPNWPKVGILARRGKNCPNQLGVTFVRIVRRGGNTLEVEGLDAIDGHKAGYAIIPAMR
jgi:tRNA (adenine37-N6)-methyltransferase